MTGRTTHQRRRLAAGLCAVTIAMGALGFAGALSGSAQASDGGSSITSPSDGSGYSANTTVPLTATVQRQATNCGILGCTADNAVYTLALTNPAGQTVGSWQDSGRCTSNGCAASYIQACLSTDHGPVADPNCSGASGSPGANGGWRLTLSGNGKTWSHGFTLAIPAKAPTQVVASVVDGTHANLSWAANPEGDIVRYEIVEGGALLGGINPADRCAAGQCSTPVAYTGANAPGDHTLEVRGVRSDGFGGTVAPGPSTSANTVHLTGPAPSPTPAPSGSPSPAPSGGTGGGTGGTGSGTGGTGTGGKGTGTGTGKGTGGTGSGSTSGGPVTTPDQQRHIAVTFKDFAPPSGIIKLPPLPVAALPGEAAIPDGTFAPTLAYGDQYLPEGVLSKKAGTTTAFVDSISQSFSGTKLWRSIAFALLLLLASGHLFVWLRRTGRPDGFDW